MEKLFFDLRPLAQPTLLLRPTPTCFNALCQFIPYLNLHPEVFRFNALWLTALRYANPVILMGKLFLFYAQFFCFSQERM